MRLLELNWRENRRIFERAQAAHRRWKADEKANEDFFEGLTWAANPRRGNSEEGSMKKYRCHKVVEAGIIQALGIDETDRVRSVDIEGGDVVPIRDPSFRSRGLPKRGDYLVRYEDGYLSWSPKKAFEDGYTEIAVVDSKEDLTKLQPPLGGKVPEAKPTIGRIVHVRQSPDDMAAPAIITGIHFSGVITGDGNSLRTLIDVAVFNVHGLEFRIGLTDDQWSWPPRV